VLFIVIGAFSSGGAPHHDDDNGQSSSAAAFRVQNGEIVHLNFGPGQSCLLAVDDAAESALARAIQNHDAGGMAELVAQNRAFGATGNARVRIIDAGVVTTTVRVEEGITAGRAGIVPNEFLAK